MDPESKRVDVYHVDDEGHYQPIQGNGKIISKELPNFVLDVTLLWQDDLPEGQQIVDLIQGMLKTE
jgi:Uma2 family endonuclease